MKSSSVWEYTTPIEKNPFLSLDLRESEQYTDVYTLVDKQRTLKRRNNQNWKYKELISSSEGLDLFQHNTFASEIDADPFRTLIQINGLGKYLASEGLSLHKTRLTYHQSIFPEVRLDYLEFMLGGQQQRLAMFSCRKQNPILDIINSMRLAGNNINLNSLLSPYVDN